MSTTANVCGHERIGYPGSCALQPGHSDSHTDADGRTWHNYGPLQHYEVVWMSNHVETVPAHQVIFPHAGMFATAFGTEPAPNSSGRARVLLHAEIDGRWVLTLSALEADIRSIRRVTDGEAIPSA